MNALAPVPLLTAREVCEFLQVSRPTLNKLTHQKQIKFIRVGRQLRFENQDVADYINRRKSHLAPFAHIVPLAEKIG